MALSDSRGTVEFCLSDSHPARSGIKDHVNVGVKDVLVQVNSDTLDNIVHDEVIDFYKN